MNWLTFASTGYNRQSNLLNKYNRPKPVIVLIPSNERQPRGGVDKAVLSLKKN